MEEKREIKISLGTVICIVIIVILLCALAFVYYLGFVKEDSKEIAKPQDNEIVFQEEKTNTVIQENEKGQNTEITKYIELTKELNSKDVLYVTKAEKNSDNTYTLYGVVFKCNENANPEYQISNTWTVTNDYRKITVSSDTICIGEYPEDEETTVGKYFNNYGEVELQEVVINTTLIDKYTYSFKFENGKCVKVIDYCTSI